MINGIKKALNNLMAPFSFSDSSLKKDSSTGKRLFYGDINSESTYVNMSRREQGNYTIEFIFTYGDTKVSTGSLSTAFDNDISNIISTMKSNVPSAFSDFVIVDYAFTGLITTQDPTTGIFNAGFQLNISVIEKR